MNRRLRWAWGLVVLTWACGGGGGTPSGDLPGGDLPSEVSGDLAQDAPGEAGRPDSLLPDGTTDDVAGEDGGTDLLPDAGEDVQTPCDNEAALARGLDWLEKAEPGFAIDELDEAVARCPSDPRALFLAGLAECIYGAEQFVSLITVLTGQTTGPRLASISLGEDPDPATWNEMLAAKLHRAFLELRNHFERGLSHLEALGEEDPGVTTAGIPLYLGIRPSLVLRGRFDAGDTMLTRAVASVATGILDVLAGQDLNTDLLTVASSVKGMFGDSVNFPMISRLAAYLLNEDARFLTLHPVDGERLFRDARERLGEVAPLLDLAIERMGEGGDGADEVSYLETLPSGVVINVRNRVRFAAEGSPSEDPWYLILSEETLEALRSCSRSIQTPGEAVTLHGGVLPTLSVLLVGFVRVGLLEPFGLTEVAGIDLASLEVDEVSGLLMGLLPNVLAFDWGHFFQQPVGLRAWLPAVTGDRDLLDNRIRADWECPDDLGPDGFPNGSLRMLCSDGATLADGGHFAGTRWETAPDGTPSPFPVLAFDDPTWNGLNLVNLAAPAHQTDLEGFLPADQTTWNAALARLLAGILSLLN